MLADAQAAQRKFQSVRRLLQRDDVAGMNQVPGIRLEIAIGLDLRRPVRVAQIVIGIGVGNAFVVNLADGQERRQFRRAAVMIPVKMRGDVVINFFQSGE